MQHFEHKLTANVKFLHKVAIIRESDGEKQVLLLQRASNSESRPDCWDLPGGNAEWPVEGQVSVADLHQADTAREVLEEANLTVSAAIFNLDHLVYFSSYFAAQKEIYTVICGWMINFADSDQAEIKISDEHQELVWVSLADLENYDFGGAKGKFVKTTAERAIKK